MRIDHRVAQRLAAGHRPGGGNGHGMDEGEPMLTAVLDAVSDPMLVTDSRWRILLANQATLTTFRYQRSELVGRRLDVLLPGAAPGGAVFGRRQDGTEFPIEASVGEVPSRSGPLEIVCIRDSRGWSNNGQSARRPESAAPAEPLGAAVVNEGRNALGILVSRIDVMLLEAPESPLPAQVRDDLAVLQRAAWRVAASLERLRLR
jgi:PAS domain-containing protein